MKRIRFKWLFFILFIFSIFFKYAVAQNKVLYKVVGGSVIRADNETHSIVATVGQPVISTISNSSTINKVGFWYQVNSFNLTPIANAGRDSTYEATSVAGAQVTLDGRETTDPDDDLLMFTWSEDNTIIAGPTIDSTSTVTLSLDTHTIELKVDDGNGGISTDTVVIKIQDTTPPVISEITAPVDPVQVNTKISVSASFTDQFGTHTALWEWGDDSTSTGQIVEENGSGTVTGNHAYTSADIYTIKLIVTDESENSGESVFYYIVTFNPYAGFVTGGGWIESPDCAYAPDTTLTGKANFRFISKYKKGKTIPEGNTQFHFKVANLKFKSTSYQWLVIAGPHVKFKASGAINGESDYVFMLTATDGQVDGGGGADKFRIKIWEKDSPETVIYDNQMGAADTANATDVIEGGSIVIHNTALSKPDGITDQENLPVPIKFALIQNYPNPFNPFTTIRFDLPESRRVVLKIYNIMGHEIITLVDKNYKPGYYSVVWDSRDNYGNVVSNGIYLYRIKAGNYINIKKMCLLR